MSSYYATWASWLAALLNRTVIIERRTLTRPLGNSTVANLGGCTELGFRTLYAMLNRSLPVRWSLLLYKSLCWSGRRSGGWFDLNSGTRANRVDS